VLEERSIELLEVQLEATIRLVSVPLAMLPPAAHWTSGQVPSMKMFSFPVPQRRESGR
jgi:hypothetical protein